ncbi:MAG: hypothetical protein IJU52_02605 [Clostridia bacterium]|nr:hypothetical protein [Clostridia bacterium]
MAVNDGALEANFPVFDEHTYNEIEQLLQPITDEVCRLMLDISDIAALVLLTERFGEELYCIDLKRGCFIWRICAK